MQEVRRARPEDAHGIHQAHMQSIREVCSKDHTAEEIAGWASRPYNEEQRLSAIKNHYVWVVEDNGSIQGYGHLQIYQREGNTLAHVHGLYLTAEAINNSLGKKIVTEMLSEAKKAEVTKIQLEATLTAHAFYEKMGFHDCAPMRTIEIGGSAVRCYPMCMELVP